jgi:pyridoxine 4-dehydrogenase
MNNEYSFGGELAVNRLGFGTMKLTGWPTGAAPAADTALAVLRRAVELGVNHIDTAAFYTGPGVTANKLIREALHPYPADLVLATKIGPRFGGEGLTPLPYAPPGELRRDVEANLTELGIDRIHIANLRVGGVSDPEEGPVAEHVEALAALREEGLIGHIGMSNVTPAQLEQARRIVPVSCVQNHYNLVHRGDDALVDDCAEAGIAFVPFFPLGGHVDPSVVQLAPVVDVARRVDATPAQVALAWSLHRSPNILAIPGTADLAHLEQNVAAAQVRLSEDDLAELNSIR